MAAVGKKKKTNWKPVSAQLIIDAKRKNNFNINCTNNWEDEVAKEMDGGNSSSILDAARLMPKVDLPTAPRASRGSIVDDSKIPHSAPFQAYLSNIPYDLIEDDLINFFQDLRVKSVRLPKEEKSSKAKGFGYIEFEDRASLSSALNLADTTIKGRAMKIELPNNSDMGGRGGNRRNNRDGGRDQTSSDRTTGNWRAGPRQDDVDDRYDRGGGGGGGSGYGGRRDYGGGSAGGSGSSSSGFNRGGFDDRNYHREERFDRGGRDDRGRDERGGGSFRDRYDRDRGFGGRGDRGGDREGFSYNDRGFRDRGTRDDDRYSRNDDRSSGSSSSHWRDDQQRGGENRGFGGGRFDDRRDRRGDDRDRDGGGKFGPPRRDEGPPIDRGNEARNRPRLQLQPRTKPKENTSEAPSTAASIFGGAKPVDTAAREREIEERLMRSEDFNESKSKANSSSGGSTRGEGGSTRGEGGSTRGEAGSTRGDRGERQWEPAEKKVEPAPPPKENAWSRKAAQSVVNNGRSTPDDDMSRSNIDSDEINQEDTRSRRSGDDRGQGNSRGPVTTTADKPRGKELERNVSKHRERKESIDDISKMPKVPETKAPNFAVSNKYSSLVDSDEAPNE